MKRSHKTRQMGRRSSLAVLKEERIRDELQEKLLESQISAILSREEVQSLGRIKLSHKLGVHLLSAQRQL